MYAASFFKLNIFGSYAGYFRFKSTVLTVLNPAVADTGLCLRPVGYERKTGLP
jgi:hypothetical protein